jgi:hypothetical protein
VVTRKSNVPEGLSCFPPRLRLRSRGSGKKGNKAPPPQILNPNQVEPPAFHPNHVLPKDPRLRSQPNSTRKTWTNWDPGTGCCLDGGTTVSFGGRLHVSILLGCAAFVCDFIVFVDCHGLSDHVWSYGHDEGCLEEDSTFSIGAAVGGRVEGTIRCSLAPKKRFEIGVGRGGIAVDAGGGVGLGWRFMIKGGLHSLSGLYDAFKCATFIRRTGIYVGSNNIGYSKDIQRT